MNNENKNEIKTMLESCQFGAEINFNKLLWIHRVIIKTNS